MNKPIKNPQMLWATLVVAVLLILTAWGNAYAMLAFALLGIIVAVVYGGLTTRNWVAATAGCVVAVFIAYALATM